MERRRTIILASMERRARTVKFLLGALALAITGCAGVSPWLSARLPPQEVTDGISGAEIKRHIARLSSSVPMRTKSRMIGCSVTTLTKIEITQKLAKMATF